MFPKPYALPHPVQAKLQDLEKTSSDELEALLHDSIKQHDELALQQGALEKLIELILAIKCGSRSAQHVEEYDGSFAVSKPFVEIHARSVGQLQWLDNLDRRFDSTENLDLVRWGTGALLKGNLFLTAGHCFGGARRLRPLPSNRGVTISPEEAAMSMQVNFNYHKVKGSTAVTREHSFPILRLVEYCREDVDYAIVELGADSAGKLPNEQFSWLTVASTDVQTEGATLCVIEHPNGRPKMIETGAMKSNDGGTITYNDIDVGGGASGAPVLHPVDEVHGEIVGVHHRGGCSRYSGTNRGVAIGAIRKVSSALP